MVSKFKKNDGYSLGFVIFLLLLASFIGIAMHVYTMSQVDTTKKAQKRIQNNYLIEMGVEDVVADFMSDLYVEADYWYGTISVNYPTRKINYKYPYRFGSNIDSSAISVSMPRNVEITGVVKEISTNNTKSRKYLLELNGVLTEDKSKPLKKKINVEVSINNINWNSYSKKLYYDLSHNIVDMEVQQNDSTN